MATDKLADLLNTSEASLKEIKLLLISDPGNIKLQHDLSSAHTNVGSIQHTQGNLAAAMNSLLSSLNIIGQLLKGDPDNNEWLYEISEIYETIGNIKFESRNFDTAITSYKYSLNIIEHLVIRDPGNVEWQYEMAMFYETIGNIHVFKGDLSAALNSYKSSLKIKEELLKNDPGNTSLQESLSISINGIENIQKRNPSSHKNLSNLNSIYEIEMQDTNSHLKEMNEFYNNVVLASGAMHGSVEDAKKAHEQITTLDGNLGRLNQVYGNMLSAMQGNPDKGAGKNSTIEPPKKENENVNFAVSFPSTMVLAESYILDVWLFLETQRKLLLERIKEESNDDISLKSEGPVIIERGTVITTQLTIEDLIVEPVEKSLTWTGDLNNSSYVVIVPENIKAGTKIGKVNFYINGLEISRLNFKVRILAKYEEDSKAKNSFAENTKYKTAFASYASKDRDEVLARVQGLEKAGIYVYMDVRNLRSGEKYEEKLMEEIGKADVFFLFWSSSANNSEWVRKEWEFALKSRGIDFINPIPLESPESAPPPSELSQYLHFGDWTLAYKRSKN